MKKLLIITILCTLILTVGCTQKVQRFGSVIGLKEEMLEKYKNLHANPWLRGVWSDLV